MTQPDESEVPDEDEWEDEETTEVTQLRDEMRGSLADLRKTLSGVNNIAEDLRRAIAAQGSRKVRRTLTPASFPAVAAVPEKA